MAPSEVSFLLNILPNVCLKAYPNFVNCTPRFLMRSHSPTPTIHIMDGTPHIKLFTDELTSAMILSNFSIHTLLFSFFYIPKIILQYIVLIMQEKTCTRSKIITIIVYIRKLRRCAYPPSPQLYCICLYCVAFYHAISLSVLQHLSRHDLVQPVDQNSVDYEVENNYSAIEYSPEPWGKCQLNAAVYI